MKTLILLSLLALTCNQVLSDETKCAAGFASCLDVTVIGKSCEEKAPVFTCLKNAGCEEDDTTYKAQVVAYGYGSCNGASAIIMGWTLPILMFTVAKYFSK